MKQRAHDRHLPLLELGTAPAQKYTPMECPAAEEEGEAEAPKPLTWKKR